MPKSSSGRFAPKEYNKITKRIRDFWLSYFLQELYKCPYSMTSFDLWGYRARQIGVIQATESYPFINGKLVYPTSVVLDAVHSDDFSEIYHYSDGKRLFVHKPTLGDEEESPYKNKKNMVAKTFWKHRTEDHRVEVARMVGGENIRRICREIFTSVNFQSMENHEIVPHCLPP